MTYMNTLLNECSKIIINSHNTHSKTYTLSGQISSTIIRPEIFSFEVHAPNHIWSYANATDRGLLEEIHRININSVFSLEIGDTNTPNLSEITRYMGDLTLASQNLARVAASQAGDSGQILRLQSLPQNLPAGSFYLRKGDYLQTQELFASSGANKVYRVTNDVPSNTLGSAVVGLHRPLFVYPSTNAPLVFGSRVRWNVYLKRIPKYWLNVQFNNTVAFDSPFLFEEDLR